MLRTPCGRAAAVSWLERERSPRHGRAVRAQGRRGVRPPARSGWGCHGLLRRGGSPPVPRRNRSSASIANMEVMPQQRWLTLDVGHRRPVRGQGPPTRYNEHREPARDGRCEPHPLPRRAELGRAGASRSRDRSRLPGDLSGPGGRHPPGEDDETYDDPGTSCGGLMGKLQTCSGPGPADRSVVIEDPGLRAQVLSPRLLGTSSPASRSHQASRAPRSRLL